VVNVNGKPTQLAPTDPRYVDYYGRPWAKNWEKYFEQGWGKPGSEVTAAVLRRGSRCLQVAPPATREVEKHASDRPARSPSQPSSLESRRTANPVHLVVKAFTGLAP